MLAYVCIFFSSQDWIAVDQKTFKVHSQVFSWCVVNKGSLLIHQGISHIQDNCIRFQNAEERSIHNILSLYWFMKKIRTRNLPIENKLDGNICHGVEQKEDPES